MSVLFYDYVSDVNHYSTLQAKASNTKKKRRLTLFCCFLFYGCCLQSMFYDFYSGQPWPIEGTPPSTATSTGPMWGSPPPPPLLDRPVRAAGGCTRETTTYAVPTHPPPATPPPTPTTMRTIRNLGRVSVLIFIFFCEHSFVCF